MPKTVSALTRENVPELASLFAHCFCNNDTLTAHLKVPESEYAAVLEQSIDSALIDGFSCVVHDAETSKLIGGAISHRYSNKIWLAEYNKHHDWFTPFEPFEAFMLIPEWVEETDPSTVLDIYEVGGLLPQEGGQRGVTEAILNYTLPLAKEKEMKYVVSLLTSPITQHVFIDKFGFKPESSVVVDESVHPDWKGLSHKTVLAVLELEKR